MTITIDSGFAFLKWLDDTIDGRRFYGGADVHRAYDRGGWEAVQDRAREGREACEKRPDLYAAIGEVWASIERCAAAEIVMSKIERGT